MENSKSDSLVKPLLKGKALAWSKLKAFEDDKLNVTQNIKLIFHCGKKKKPLQKGENACYQHFLFFQQCLQTAFF